MFSKFSYHFLHIFAIALIVFTVNACLQRLCLIPFTSSLHIMVFCKYLFIKWWLFHNESEGWGQDRLDNLLSTPEWRYYYLLFHSDSSVYKFYILFQLINSACWINYWIHISSCHFPHMECGGSSLKTSWGTSNLKIKTFVNL